MLLSSNLLDVMAGGSRCETLSDRSSLNGDGMVLGPRIVGSKTKSLVAAVSSMVQNLVDLSSCHDVRCANYIGAAIAEEDDSSLDEVVRATTLAEDAPFETYVISKKLHTTFVTRSKPVEQFVMEITSALGAPNSPLRSSPETLIHALVLLERIQHLNVIEQMTPGMSRTTSFQTGVVAPPSDTDTKVRTYIDSAVMEKKTSIMSRFSGRTERSSRCTGKSDVSNAISEEVHTPATSPIQSAPKLCVDCREARPVMVLDRRNIHLFVAAALLIAMKTREDVVQPDKVLANMSEILGLGPNRPLFLAERCLCATLDFNCNVSVGEYRAMLYRLNHLRSENGGEPFLSMFAP